MASLVSLKEHLLSKYLPSARYGQDSGGPRGTKRQKESLPFGEGVGRLNTQAHKPHTPHTNGEERNRVLR